MTDRLQALIDAAYEKRVKDGDLPRRPENNPWTPVPTRGPRRITYRDPTGSDAAGAAKQDDPDGAKARARAAHRERKQ